MTVWTSWTGPGATTVTHVLADNNPARFRPVQLTHPQQLLSRTQQRWARPQPRIPGLGDTPLRPRKVAALHASGLPAPTYAVAAAADGRAHHQALLVDRAERKCLHTAASLPPNSSRTQHLDALDGELLRIATDRTLRTPWWEPELVIGERPGAVTVRWHSPVDTDGTPTTPAAAACDSQQLVDEHTCALPTESFVAAEATDVDPAGLTLRCIPPRLVRDAVCRPRSTRTLEDLWRQTLAAPHVPAWVTAEHVENRLRNLLAELRAPRTHTDTDR